MNHHLRPGVIPGFCFRLSRVILAFTAPLILQSSLPAMTVNLALPYKPDPSRPRAAGISFVAPDSESFLFDGSRPARIRCIPHQRALELEWTLARNRFQTPFASGRVLPGFDNTFLVELPVDLPDPGFYDLRVSVKLTDDLKVAGTTTFGWKAGQMPAHPVVPKDFTDFWKRALAELDAVSPTPTIKFEKVLKDGEVNLYNITNAALPENYDPDGVKYSEVEIYRVTFPSANGAIVHGWFTKPVGEGPFPTLLILPGAGNAARPAPVEHARHGYAALDIQVHANPIDALKYSPLPADISTDPRQRMHFSVYLNALQAARVLPNLPGVDPSRMAVLGGSQGGRLSLVVAALAPRFKAAIPAIAHFANIPWLNWTDRMNEVRDPGRTPLPDFDQNSLSNASDAYFDVLNFAPLIRCPVLMNAGLADPVSPATGIFAAYNALTSRKQIIALPNTGHDWAPAFDRYAWQWLDTILNETRSENQSKQLGNQPDLKNPKQSEANLKTFQK